MKTGMPRSKVAASFQVRHDVVFRDAGADDSPGDAVGREEIVGGGSPSPPAPSSLGRFQSRGREEDRRFVFYAAAVTATGREAHPIPLRTARLECQLE